jgi:hypothetical protein
LWLIEKLAPSLSMNVEAKNLGFIEVDLRWHDDCIGEMFEENMRKTSSEVGAININLSKLW